MSAIFPKGEAFFIDSVRNFRDGAPPELQGEINAFIRQEATHSREHVAFNRRVADAGYDIARLEQRIDDRVAEIRTHSEIACLNSTMVSEHLTSILSHELLSNPLHMAKAPDEARRLWEWHALEEIEHKAVAFDTWMHATRDWSRVHRWLSRSKMMLIVSRNFMVDRAAGISELLRQDGQRNLKNWARLFWYLMVYPGMMRRITFTWAAWFVPGFHPWKHDDRHLIARVNLDEAKDGDRQPAAA
jgi:predicted metal-dependent hydrolase